MRNHFASYFHHLSSLFHHHMMIGDFQKSCLAELFNLCHFTLSFPILFSHRIIPFNPLIHIIFPIYNHLPFDIILTTSRLLILLLGLRILPFMCSFSLYIYLNLSSIAFYVVSIFFYIKPLMINIIFLQIKKVGIV